MPTYAYECPNCGYEFERVQKFTDDPITRCPNCKKNKVRRVIQASPVVFKGSGWYITDHRSNSKKTASSSSNGDKADKSEKSTEAAETTSTAEKTETPAKAESKPAKNDGGKKSKSNSD